MGTCSGGEKRRIVAVSVIINPTDCSILVGHKIKYNQWEFPGGKINPNEKIIDAGLRELKEETGIIPKTYDFVTFWDHKKWLAFIFTGISEEEPQLLEPDKHYAWHFLRISDFFELVNRGAVTKVTAKFSRDTVFQCLTKLKQRDIL